MYMCVYIPFIRLGHMLYIYYIIGHNFVVTIPTFVFIVSDLFLGRKSLSLYSQMAHSHIYLRSSCKYHHLRKAFTGNPNIRFQISPQNSISLFSALVFS